MLFNVPFETIRTLLPLESGFIFYLEDEEKIELYISQANAWLKSTYLKVGTEEDLIWKDDYLKRAIRVFSVDKGDVTFRIEKVGGS